jgi:hypothetical protein
MTASLSWQRRLAMALIRHAAYVLRPTRPEWSEALKGELAHVPGNYRVLTWALGCVRASYFERYLGRSWPVLAAIAVGLVFAVVDEFVTGAIAAVAWPHWYTAFATMHKHMGLEIWWVVAETLPIACIAAGFGGLLARLAKASSMALPCVSIAAWVIYALLPVPSSCIVLLRTLWEDFLRFPISNVASVILPISALILGFHRFRVSDLRDPPASSPAG